MEVHFSPEQEARLAQLARHDGVDAKQLVRNATMSLLENEERFRAAVREGIAAAERGEFIDHNEVWANIESILRSQGMYIRWTAEAAQDLYRLTRYISKDLQLPHEGSRKRSMKDAKVS